MMITASLIHPLPQEATLAMMRAHDFATFYCVSGGADRFSASIVVADGFRSVWGMGTGFWDGLNMAENQVMNGECAGPTEDG